MGAVNFWEDLELAAANLVKDALLGERIDKVALELEKSTDLLYKAANPHLPQQLNLLQWLKVLKKTQNFAPVRQLAEACGFLVLPGVATRWSCCGC